MSFLKAEWRKLAIANYEIDEALIKKYIPYKTELDKWNGRTYLSLVGFRFVNTKLLGVKIPFHTNFEEVNLRFYVKCKDGETWKRGVVFIKEIVPRMAITFVANTIYKERYETMPMAHRWMEEDGKRIVEYEWICKKKRQIFMVESDLNPTSILAGSEEEFITEHYWGYTRVNQQKTYGYEVTHPTWECYPVHKFEIAVDFGLVYGKGFEVLSEMRPTSVMLAEGSAITVENVLKI